MPRTIRGQPAFAKHFQETGFWTADEGMLLMVSPADELVGHVEFFKTVAYLDELELAYQVYAPDQRRKGLATQAVTLLVDYLFETRPVNRLRLVIHPANVASRRLAETCGFQHESTARGAW